MTRRDEIWTQNLQPRPCPVCGADRHLLFSAKMQHGLDLPTVICHACGFVFTNPLPPRDVYERFYTDAYASYYGAIAMQPQGYLREHCPPQTGRWLKVIAQYLPLRGARLLELGPGQGLFLWWAQKAGAEVLGLEPSPEFYDVLQSSGLPAVCGALESVDTATLGQFDVLAMFHVLEHFYDPNLALQRCRDLLKDGGLLAVEVPNILKPFRSLDNFFLRYVHPSSFSAPTLTHLLQKHGFEVLSVNAGSLAWTGPQSLHLLARKCPLPFSPPALPGMPAGAVLAHLQAYRRRWVIYGALRWQLYTASRPLRSLAKRIFRRLNLIFSRGTTL